MIFSDEQTRLKVVRAATARIRAREVLARVKAAEVETKDKAEAIRLGLEMRGLS